MSKLDLGKSWTLEERIQELEGDLVEAQCERDYFMNEVVEARQRIRKAREIVKVIALDSDSSWSDKAKEALEALEGK